MGASELNKYDIPFSYHVDAAFPVRLMIALGQSLVVGHYLN